MYKLIFSATGDDVRDRYDNLITFTSKKEAKNAALNESLFIYKNRPHEFSDGGFLYGTKTQIVSLKEID